VKTINKQNLSWTARFDPHFEGKRVNAFGLGYAALPADQRKTRLVQLMTGSPPPTSASRTRAAANQPILDKQINSKLNTGNDASVKSMRRADASSDSVSPAPSTTTSAIDLDYTPTDAYDARDIRPGQPACRAYQALDQGACGACYAFATAAAFSARVCRAFPGSVGDVALSPQQIMDCTGGCAGGSELDAYQSLVSRPGVELWCDPFTGGDPFTEACGAGVCGSGNAFGGLLGSVRQVGGGGALGVMQMQLELVRGGPGVVSFTAMDDLFGYGGGVYSPSPSAAAVGGHAVARGGWGVDQGVPYWVCQNSWGAAWGEGGFFRIARGSDTCGIESTAGLVVATPAQPAGCPESDCSTGSTTLSDCTCRCPPGRAGPTCAECTLTCLNGGVRDAGCTHCTCPPGFWGAVCEGGYSAGPLASCAQDAWATLAVDYAFGGAVPPPTQGSFVGVYALSEANPFGYAAAPATVCGGAYSATFNGGLCPASGAFRLARPTVPGQYKVAVAPYSPMDSLGYQG
jgi:hypothetical protein